jgi:surface carbohydrate biosynthesis protein
MNPKALLIIPVENQVRELDPKLLLTCIAARHGFASIIGSRREIHFHITAFPRGIYLSKSITAASDMMFRIMRDLGHEIVAWDEEALVHLPAETYYSRRLSPVAMKYVSHFLAWGEENAELWRQYPHFPERGKIEITGNPRNDLLRSEMRAYYRDEVDRIRERYGKFILVNTNFNHVNAFTPVQNLFQPVTHPDETPQMGRAAKGMTHDYAEGLFVHKQAIFDHFQKMIPELDQMFQGYSIVVRPHPTESQAIYHRIASRCRNVQVTNEGNVVPWLMACQALIHNGCTTGIEAYAMGIPTISYRATVDARYDEGFYRLPNLVSEQCFDLDELKSMLATLLDGAPVASAENDRQKSIDWHLAALSGPLACERIVAVLEQLISGDALLAPSSLGYRLRGKFMATARTAVKRFKDSRPGSHNRKEFQRHRYPRLTKQDIATKLWRFQQIINKDQKLSIEPFLEQFFLIEPQTRVTAIDAV